MRGFVVCVDAVSEIAISANPESKIHMIRAFKLNASEILPGRIVSTIYRTENVNNNTVKISLTISRIYLLMLIVILPLWCIVI